jgi:hypothetical protein
MTALGITPWIATDEVETPSVPATAEAFARKAIYVICNASVAPDVGRHAYERCMRALASGSTARAGFRHARKAEAIDEVWRRRDELFEAYRASASPVAYLETLPWIGPVMRHSLAYLLGLSDAPPREGVVARPAMDGSRTAEPERPKASEVGFCVVDGNADFIADHLVRRIHDAAVELESEVNRLYRGRNSYDLNGVARIDLEKAIERLTYMAKSLRDVESAQDKVVYLQAAE